MNTAWALRRAALLSDCIVSPDVFNQMVDRLGEFVMPYQQALETEAGQRNIYLYLQGPHSSGLRGYPRLSHKTLAISMRYLHDVSSTSAAISREMRHGTDRQSASAEPYDHRRFQR
jgi:hypothetical protein